MLAACEVTPKNTQKEADIDQFHEIGVTVLDACYQRLWKGSILSSFGHGRYLTSACAFLAPTVVHAPAGGEVL